MNAKRKNVNTIILVLGGLAALGPFSIDMYLPGFAGIAKSLSTDMATVGYSLTAYFLGICFGQLIYGPVIDRFGRKKPILFGLSLFTAASVGCANAPGIVWFIACRTLQALGGCVGMVAGRAVVRDLFPVSVTAKIFSTLMLVMGVAPVIAPTVGGIVANMLGWRYIFWILALFSSFMMLVTYFFLPESKVPDSSVSLMPGRVLFNYFAVLKNRGFLVYALASGFLSSGMFAYIGGSAFVYMKLFGMNEKQFGWIYAVNVGGLIGASQLNRLLLRRYSSERISFYSALAQSIVCLLLVISAFDVITFKTPFCVLIFLFLAACGILNPNTTALSMASCERSAGSASAMLGFTQMFFGTLSSCLVSLFHDDTAVPMAAVMAGYSLLGLVCLVIRFSFGEPVVEKGGKTLRSFPAK